MSRLGKMPIELPEKVEVKIADAKIHVKGPKGNITHSLSCQGIELKMEEKRLFVVTDENANML